MGILQKDKQFKKFQRQKKRTMEEDIDKETMT